MSNYPIPCPKYPSATFNKKHVAQCLNMYNKLQVPATSEALLILPFEFISVLVNHASALSILCPTLILYMLLELDYLHFNQHTPPLPSSPGRTIVY
jgi:hypothetical protein